MEKKSTAPPKGRLRENIEAIVIAVLLALFIRAFVVQAFKIPSGSMKETLQIGDHILVNKFIYGIKLPLIGTPLIPISRPERKDIVVFRYPEDPDKDFIKRTVAVEGDTVAICDKQLSSTGPWWKKTTRSTRIHACCPRPSSHGTTWIRSPCRRARFS